MARSAKNESIRLAAMFPIWPRTWATAVLTLSLVVSPLHLIAQSSTTPEYRAKSRFLAHFPGFIEWPASVFPSPDAPFLICVYGDFSFGSSLAENTRALDVSGHRLSLVWVRKASELTLCQILFISGGDSRRSAKALDAVRGHSILTVGETPDFLAAGGAVTFSFAQEVLQFDINLEAVESAHLKMSSQMLAMARRVLTKTAGAKS